MPGALQADGRGAVRPLLEKVFEDGKLVRPLPPLSEAMAFARAERDTFWDEYKRLEKPHIFKVDLSQKLFDLKNSLLEERHATK